MKILFLVFVLTVSGIAAEKAQSRLLGPKKAKASRQSLSLYQVDTDAKIPSQSKELIAFRVYATRAAANAPWIYWLTDWEGRLPKADEHFKAGTVISGGFLGAKNPYHKFELTSDGKWIVSQKEEKHFFYTEDPGLTKVVWFVEPDLAKK